jgi:gluconolactonase
MISVSAAQESEHKSDSKKGLQSLVKTGAEIRQLETGFGFVEGPAADRKGNVYFTDIPNNKIHIRTVNNELRTFRENSGAANGLAFLNDSTLVVCEGGNRRLTAISLKGEVTVLADQYEGKKLNSPNDIWIDPRGGMYFTDPRYGNRDNMELREDVYYLTPDRKELIRVIDDLVRPNGIIGTPDGRVLYVADRGDDANYRYSINEDGTLSGKTFFCSEGSDGMALDNRGNLYITSPLGSPYRVSVFNAEGEKIEEIHVPEMPANVAFGGVRHDVLFITARTSLYAIQMNVRGAGKKEEQK